MTQEMNKHEAFLEAVPAVDVVEEKDKAVVYFEVPGCGPQNVHLEVRDSVLTMEADSSLCRHGKQIRFKRSFELSDSVDIDKIHAKTQDGILTLTLPTAEHAQVRRIAVE